MSEPNRPDAPAISAAGRGFRLLPLILLASMLAIASILEPLRYGTWLWPPKIPLAVLLAWVFLRPARRS